jgi:hypothetical protein
MPTPLSATTRLRLAYQLKGEPHELRCYVKLGAPLGGVQQLTTRSSTTLAWTLAGQGLWDAVRNVLSTGVIDANVVFLESFDGTFWNILDTLLPTGAAAGGSTFFAASQLTFVLRDTGHHKMRFQVMEHGQGYAGHSIDGTGLGTPISILASDFTSTPTDSNPPYIWQVSRANLYLASTVPIAGVTLDSNDKLRRRRELA